MLAFMIVIKLILNHWTLNINCHFGCFTIQNLSQRTKLSKIMIYMWRSDVNDWHIIFIYIIII